LRTLPPGQKQGKSDFGIRHIQAPNPEIHLLGFDHCNQTLRDDVFQNDRDSRIISLKSGDGRGRIVEEMEGSEATQMTPLLWAANSFVFTTTASISCSNCVTTGASSLPMRVSSTVLVVRSNSRTPKVSIQLADLLCQGRLRKMQEPRRPGKTAEPRDRHESLKLPQIEVEMIHNQ
jgi:hypothetical protein